jgi:glycerophosphoryl diester phosphodiesterase
MPGKLIEIASHRGGALLWPENSRVAFEATARLPVEQVEFDVHPTRDDKLVVIHDATLERTSDGSGPVVEKSWGELSHLILKGTGGQRMLLLEEVIAIFRATALKLRLEIKAGPDQLPYPGLADRVVATLAREGVLERTIVTSFQIGTLGEVARQGVPAERIWLVAPSTLIDIGGIEGVLTLARANRIAMLGLRSSTLDAAMITSIRAAKIRVGAWACNDAATIARMLSLDIDVFTTDRPDVALALRAGAKPHPAEEKS